jgi:hypothetical protein
MHFTSILRSLATVPAQSKRTVSEQDFEGSHDEYDVFSVRLELSIETSGADLGPWHQKSVMYLDSSHSSYLLDPLIRELHLYALLLL